MLSTTTTTDCHGHLIKERTEARRHLPVSSCNNLTQQSKKNFFSVNIMIIIMKTFLVFNVYSSKQLFVMTLEVQLFLTIIKTVAAHKPC